MCSSFLRLGILVELLVCALVVCETQERESLRTIAGNDDVESRLTNVRQLTFGGENAEAYFSFDGSRLIFQSTRDSLLCDQMFTMDRDGLNTVMVSNGAGRTSCGYFYPDGESILYASTHLMSGECPTRPSLEHGYVWPVDEGYDIFRATSDGSSLTRLTDTPGYDAEATVDLNGRIVFTSARDDDLEIYSMNGDGSEVRRLTNRLGPDGGAFFSPDGEQIVFRGHEISPGTELEKFQSLLGQGLWRPTNLEIFVMNADGSNLRQVTKLGGANFAPFWHPDGQRIIFSSNWHNARGRNFDLFLIHVDGSGLERVTFDAAFDGFPMFSPEGTELVFASNRRAQIDGETNVFIADWVEN